MLKQTIYLILMALVIFPVVGAAGYAEFSISKSSSNYILFGSGSNILAFSKEGEFIVVPGKILSQGDLNKKVTVAAYRFSEKAKEKINKLGKAILIQQLMKDNPKGKKVRILG